MYMTMTATLNQRSLFRTSQSQKNVNIITEHWSLQNFHVFWNLLGFTDQMVRDLMGSQLFPGRVGRCLYGILYTYTDTPPSHLSVAVRDAGAVTSATADHHKKLKFFHIDTSHTTYCMILVVIEMWVDRLLLLLVYIIIITSYCYYFNNYFCLFNIQ